MSRVFTGEWTLLRQLLRPVERFVYWYCGAATVVSAIQPAGLGRRRAGIGVQHRGQLRHQHELAVLSARDHDGLPRPDGGLTVHNFVSAAVGIVLAIALVRGFTRHEASGIGNFWVDLTRCTLYILLPISVLSPFSS